MSKRKTAEELLDGIDNCFPQNRGFVREALEDSIEFILAQGREEGAKAALKMYDYNDDADWVETTTHLVLDGLREKNGK